MYLLTSWPENKVISKHRSPKAAIKAQAKRTHVFIVPCSKQAEEAMHAFLLEDANKRIKHLSQAFGC